MRTLLAGVLLLAVVPSQDPREALWKSLRELDRVLELRWRRDAAGNLEYAVAGKADAPFVPLFGKGLWESAQLTGIAGPLALLLHSGDLLSLTSGERHLRRLAIGTSEPALLALVRAPAGALDVATLDRMVAIDILRSRDTEAARSGVAALTADEALPPALRERARGAVVKRQRLDASMPLPATADCYVVVDNERLPAADWIVELGHFMGLLSSAQVLEVLKAPTENDFLIGEVESQTITELPFEVARRLGNPRLDHTCLAFTMPARGASTGMTWCSAGRFQPATFATAIAKDVKPPPVSTQADGTVKLEWPDATITVSETRLCALIGAEASRRPDVAALLLRPGPAVRVHLPTGSQLLRLLPNEDLQALESAELELTLDQDVMTVTAELRATDAAAAARVGKAVTELLTGPGIFPPPLQLPPGLLKDLLKVTPLERLVRASVAFPRSRLPTREQIRAKLLEDVKR